MSADLISEITSFSFELRIPSLKNAGIITDVCLGIFSCGIRPIVVISIRGLKVPFYRSANGSSGKEKGKWHVFFGFGKVNKREASLSWMIKGTLEDLKNDYNCQAIKYYCQLLNETLNWDHALDLTGKNQYFNPHITFTTGTKVMFNELVYGTTDRAVFNDGQGSSRIRIDEDIQAINAAFGK